MPLDTSESEKEEAEHKQRTNLEQKLNSGMEKAHTLQGFFTEKKGKHKKIGWR